MTDDNLKERLVGAAVLVFLAVIFIPMFLSDEPPSDEFIITESNIPEKPQSEFSSRIIPLEISDDPIAQKVKELEAKETVTAVEETGEPAREIEDQTVKKIEQSEVGVTAWIVQLGSFTSEENAQSLNKQLREKNYPAFVEPLVKGDKVIYRVRVGPELRREDAEKTRSVLKKTMKLDGILVKYP